MAKKDGKKSTSGTRNDKRPNGKAWKQGKDPATREAEAKAKRDAKKARKATIVKVN